MASMVIQSMTLYCLLQHETAEEYKAAMGIGGVSHGEKDVAAGNASRFDPALEGRRKYAEGFGQGAAAVDAAEEARRRAAADEVMKQLLGALLRLPSSANCCTLCTACPQI